MSLSQTRAHTTLPVQDMARARSFYEDVLELAVERETPAGVLYSAAEGTRLLLFPSGSTPGGHTQIGWAVADLDAEMSELRSRGVVFEEYDFPSLKTVDGVATSPVGRSAWFKDTEGNVHGLIEFS